MRRRTWGHRCLGALVVLGALLMSTAIPVGTAIPAGAAAAADTSATARASVDDTTLSWGQSTTVHGSGWAPGTAVRVVLFAGNTPVGSGTAGADGSISIPITTPSGIASSTKYQLTVQGLGSDGLVGYVALPVTVIGPVPAISIASTQVHWDETTTVSGVRYLAGSTVTVSLFPQNTTLTTAVVGSGDTFDASITIPSHLDSSTAYRIAVSGEGSDQLFHLDFLSITIIGTRPTLHVSKGLVPRGSTVTVTGTLFRHGTTVTLTLLPGYEKLGTLEVAPDDTFSTVVTIPDKAGGIDPHAILATGQGDDGLFAYVVAQLDLGGKPPTGSSTGSAEGFINGTETPSTTSTTVARVTGTLPPVGALGNVKKGPNRTFVILLILLLSLLAMVLLVVTSRRDVRRKVGAWYDRQRARLGRPRP